MSEKKNHLWRLDVLEAHFLEKPVRYQRTKSLLRAKGKNKANLLPESKERALQEIEALRSDVFAKKLHSSLVKYNRVVKKTIKAASTDKKLKDEEKKFIRSLDVGKIANVRIIKLTSTVYKLNAKKLLTEPETRPGFIPQWIIDALVDKKADLNPSRFYNELSNEQRNWYSKLMNNKDIQEVVDVIENSFKIVLGPVKKADDIEDVDASESEDEDKASDDESEDADSEESDDDSDSERQEIDDDDFSMYDKYLAGTDDEDDEQLELDPTINYNEITDEEPSDDDDEAQDSESVEPPAKKKGKKETAAEVDDFFVFESDEKPKKEKKTKEDKKKEKADKKKKVSLPELQGGFISASEESDVEFDNVVEEITGPQKKNRRGQRARQKIWEQKFGRGANHVKKDKEERWKISEQKQKEWEEREAKRQAKAAEMTGANSSKLGERKATTTADGKSVPPPRSSGPALHPSWEAKKKQEAALKNTKFQGKKVVF